MYWLGGVRKMFLNLLFCCSPINDRDEDIKKNEAIYNSGYMKTYHHELYYL